jgi:hypothetical protein
MLVKFPYSASRRVAARRPRRSKNGTPEERAAKAAAKLGPPATVTAICFDPAVWLERCAAAGMQVCEHNGSLFFGVADADWDQTIPLMIQFTGAPGAKEAVKAILRSPDSKSAAVS